MARRSASTPAATSSPPGEGGRVSLSAVLAVVVIALVGFSIGFRPGGQRPPAEVEGALHGAEPASRLGGQQGGAPLATAGGSAGDVRSTPAGDAAELVPLLDEVADAADAPDVSVTKAAMALLTARLDANPGSVRAVAQRALLCDREGRSQELAALLVAMGASRDEGVLRAAFDLHGLLRPESRGLLIQSLAQDRGAATVDPSGERTFAALHEVRDVGEPWLLDGMVALLRLRTAGAGPDASMAHADTLALLRVLAASAHRSPDTDAVLVRLAGTDGPWRAHAASAYLARARTPVAGEMALQTLDDERVTDTQVLRAAVMALRRKGPSADAVARHVVPAMSRPPASRAADIIREAPVLATGAHCPPEVRRLLLDATRELAASPDAVIRGAAVEALAALAPIFGGWAALGVDPVLLMDDVSLGDAVRNRVAYAWGVDCGSAIGGALPAGAESRFRDTAAWDPITSPAMWRGFASGARRAARLAAARQWMEEVLGSAAHEEAREFLAGHLAGLPEK